MYAECASEEINSYFVCITVFQLVFYGNPLGCAQGRGDLSDRNREKTAPW